MKGAEMLKAGESVTNTAYATGFGSPSHFTTRFKKYYNLTPRQFIQQWSASSDDDIPESK
jgi:AraC-like DNA-binding protein